MLYNIVVCDDNNYYLNLVINITKNFFNTKVGFDCKIHSFHDYNDEFINFIYNNRLSNLIYLLDIETPSSNGFDIVRKIKRLDPNIPIIYITGYYNDYTKKALNTCDMVGYINKFKNLNYELEKKLDKILESKGKKYIFHIKGSNNIGYTINVKEINCFITHEKNQVKIIGIEYPNLYVSMKKLYDQLDYRFIRSHQSCIINFDNVKEFYIKSKIIYFKDGTFTDLISRDFISKNIDWICEHYMSKIRFL